MTDELKPCHLLNKTAHISDCGQYRYSLTRTVRGLQIAIVPNVMFIMLNPSTADADIDDPTIRRCINYANDWGFKGLRVCNLFAYRSTDPKQLKHVADPVGKLNNDAILQYAEYTDLIVCAWGNHGSLKNRSDEVKDLLSNYDLYCLSVTKNGEPAHPLYLKKDLKPVLWNKRTKDE